MGMLVLEVLEALLEQPLEQQVQEVVVLEDLELDLLTLLVLVEELD